MNQLGRLATKCQRCSRPLPGVEGPTVCGACELPYLRGRVLALQYGIAVLVQLQGGYVEICRHELRDLDDRNVIETWTNEKGNVCIRLRRK